jgi:alkaline phosphatase D
LGSGDSAPPVATEFIGGSITSTGPSYEKFAAWLPDNPQVRFFDSRRHGYAICTLTPQQWRTDFRVVDTVEEPVSPVATLASFVVDSGRAGARPA